MLFLPLSTPASSSNMAVYWIALYRPYHMFIQFVLVIGVMVLCVSTFTTLHKAQENTDISGDVINQPTNQMPTIDGMRVVGMLMMSCKALL